MGAIEIILIIACALIVVGVITKSIIDKKQGKCSCDCCDGNCSLCGKYKKAVESSKFYRCDKCGAVAREIVPCNCSCGIECCGEKMKEISDPHIGATGKYVSCSSCNAKAEILIAPPENHSVSCCGEEMK